MRKVVFYYPSLIIGGAELLFVRCAKFLSENTNYDVFYVDYIKGFARNKLLDTNVSFIDYEKGEKFLLLENSITIAQLNILHGLENRFQFTENNHILLWSIHPKNLINQINIRNRFFSITRNNRRKIGRLLKELSDVGVIKYMDYSNYISASKVYFFNSEDISFLPVPIEEDSVLDRVDISKSNIINKTVSFLWLSRLDIDKKNTLLTFMNELESLSSKQDIILHIVGDGTETTALKEKSGNCSYKIIFHGEISGSNLNSFIDSNVDIGLAMGTSTLEIAKRAKPVIVKGSLSKVYAAFELNDYVFLHEEYGFSLGSPSFKDEYQSSFESKVFVAINNYKEAAIRSYNYTIANHLLTNTGMKLKESLDNVASLDDKMIKSKILKINKVYKEGALLEVITFLRNIKQKLSL